MSHHEFEDHVSHETWHGNWESMIQNPSDFLHKVQEEPSDSQGIYHQTPFNFYNSHKFANHTS